MSRLTHGNNAIMTTFVPTRFYACRLVRPPPIRETLQMQRTINPGSDNSAETNYCANYTVVRYEFNLYCKENSKINEIKFIYKESTCNYIFHLNIYKFVIYYIAFI